MSYIKEKVSYIRGLADGLEIQDAAQQKLFQAIIEALDLLADAAEESEASIDEMNDCIEDIMDELDSIDEVIFSEDDEDDEDFVEVVCPNCGETIYFDQEMLESEDDLICPNCNESVLPADEEEIED